MDTMSGGGEAGSSKKTDSLFRRHTAGSRCLGAAHARKISVW